MAQILIKGESVYQCSVCARKIRVLTSRDGIDVVQRCTITYSCRGKLNKLTTAVDVNTTPAFPTEVPGVKDWFQRKILYTHQQPIKSKVWTVNHNLANKPIVYAYTTRQTEASATHSSTNVAAGTIWYKSNSGYDINNPYNPTAVGLYEYNGTRWVTPSNVISVGMQGSTIFEYLVLTEPESIKTIDSNTTEITFSVSNSGLLQCVSLASQNTSNPQQSINVDTTSVFKISNVGEITIATLDENININVSVNFKSAIVHGGVDVVFNGVDNVASVASPWVGASKIFVNGRTYTVRSFNLSNTPPVPAIMASGDVDPLNALFTFKSFGSNINENLILIGNAPYTPVDRIYNQFIDIALLNAFDPPIAYRSGEIYVKTSNIKTIYPLILTVD
jgi:hypothetical protein